MADKLTYDEVAALVAANNKSGQADAVIIALIYKESRFDPNIRAATSTATGLMQMTTGAVTEVNRVCKTSYTHISMTVAASNILVGSNYVRIRIERAGGDLAKGLDGFGTGTGYSTPILRAAARLAGTRTPMQVLLEEIGKP